MTLSRQFPPAAITLAVGYFAPIFAPMIKHIKIGIVILGYILAFVSALAAVFLQMVFYGYNARAGILRNGSVWRCASLFAPFRDAGACANRPRVLFFASLYNILELVRRGARNFSLATPAVAIANTLMNAISRYGDSVFGLALSLFGILGVFAAPVFLVGFLVLALMAPTSRARGGLLLSAGLQASAGLYTFANLVFFQRFF